MKNLDKILLVLIFVLGAFLRFYKLDKAPYSVNFDEAALGYNSYSLLKTGRDEYGYKWPLSLRSFNDYKPALYAYLSIPFVALMGLNNVSIRMVSAMSGMFSLLFLYLLLKHFFKDKKLILLLFLFLSVQPWRIHFSRTALETNLSAMFFSGGAYFLLTAKKQLDKKNIRKIFLSVLFFALSVYSYHSARVAVPILMFLWIVDPLLFLFDKKPIVSMFKNMWQKKVFFGFIILFLILVLPIFISGKSKLLLTRFRQENIFSRYAPYSPKELIKTDKPFLEWRAHPIYYLGALLSGHVLSYVSPINLSQRIFHWVRRSVQSIPDGVIVGWLESILFVSGFLFLLKFLKKRQENRFLLYWILAGAIPAAVTWNWFHPLRSLNIYPAIEIIIALALFRLWMSKKKICLLLIGGLWLLTTIFYLNNELVYSVWQNHGEYQPGGFRNGVPILAKIQDDYDQVIIDSPHAQSYIFFLFYQSFDPELFQSYSYLRPAPGVEGNLNFDFWKYKFGEVNWLSEVEKGREKTIFWTSGEIKKEEIENEARVELIEVENAVGSKTKMVVLD